jgi:hypothetical protein
MTSTIDDYVYNDDYDSVDLMAVPAAPLLPVLVSVLPASLPQL